MELILKLLVAGGVMGVLDYVWLGHVAKKLYYSELGKVLLDKPNMIPALIFYVIYVVGIVVFVVNPALREGSIWYSLGYGALFGLVTYATYNLTNLSVAKGFSAKIVAIDMAWGMFLAATVASLTFLAVRAWIS